MVSFETMRLIKTFAFCFLFSSPAWALVAFAAYAFGRKQYGISMLLLLMLVEAIAVMMSLAAIGFLTEARE